MRKYFIVTIILLITVIEGYANTCVKDLNGDGVIDAKTEKWARRIWLIVRQLIFYCPGQ
jgi:hypothetical protein